MCDKIIMRYRDFVRNAPVLYGQIIVNGRAKTGSFHVCHDRYNGYCYRYHTERGNRGSGCYPLQKAYSLYRRGLLSTDPEKGKSTVYIK